MSPRLPSLAALFIAVLAFLGALTHSLRAVSPSDLTPNTAEPVRVAEAQAGASASSFTGPGSCAAVACHGAVRPVAGSRILHTEYSTWVAQDRHARAAEVLSNSVSARIAKTLGLGAANTAPKCLACHSLQAPEGRQGRTFASEGVSCEACHGPASAWLGPHTTRGWSHAQSVQLGMYDTKDPVKRTEGCLTCHLGTAEKFVDHEMIAAGHPDLVFDLEAFSAAMPRHWRAAADGPSAPVRSFSVGQLVHLRSALDRLTRRIKGPSWPEYAELDCFACHHSLTRAEDSWRQSTGYENRRPGAPPLNLSRWTTARHVLAAYDAQAATEMTEVMTSLASETSRLRPNEQQVTTLAARGRTILDRGIARAMSAPGDAALAGRLLRAIASEAEQIALRGERAAEQAAMAMDTLYAASAGEGAAAARPAFDELFQQFQNPSSYDPRRFVTQVRKIQSAIGR